MKPPFALDFRSDSIALLHRTARGWTEVGRTGFAAPDMEEALSFLRASALELSPGGVSTKLIIPNEQILYLAVRAPGPDAARRRKQIAAALEGRTPYALSDLVFDWSGKGDEVAVAVIARQTLAEAEGFAQSHRFHPLSFVAVPPDGVFEGEPFFGPSAGADEILTPGEKLERDDEPVRIIGREAGQAEPIQPIVPEVAAPPLAEPAADLPPRAPEPTPEPTADAATPATPGSQAAGPEEAPEPEPDAVTPAELEPPSPKPAEAPAEPAALAPEPAAETTPERAAEPAPPPAADFQAVLDQTPEPALAEPAALAATDLAEAPALPDDAPIMLDADEEPAAAPQAGGFGSRFGFLKAFAARREPDSPRAPKPTGGDGLPPPALAASLAAKGPEVTRGPSVTSTEIAGSAGLTRFTSLSSTERAPAPGPGSASESKLAASRARFGADRPAAARPAAAAAAGPAKATAARPPKAKGLGYFVNAASLGGSKAARPTAPARPAGAAAPTGAKAISPARPPARPIGLGGRPVETRGRTRYLGLILTCVLLVLLALVGAWSTILASNRDEAASSVATAEASPETTALADVPAPEDEMLADLQDPAELAAVDGEAGAEPAPDEAAPAPEPAPQDGPDAAGPARTAPTGETQDEIFLAALDAPPQMPDPSALSEPSAARSDALPAPAMPPPPFGTVYQFDADGRIIPTPDGIATPEGVLLVAGRPPIVPAPRPDEVLAAASARAAVSAAAPVETGAGNPSTVAADTAAPPAEGAATALPPADPALEGKRPAQRPADLVPATQNGNAEDPALAPGSDSRLASLRPVARPAQAAAAGGSVVDTAAIDAAVASASLVTDAGVLPLQGGGLAASPKPATRPATLATAALADGTDTAAAEADSEPELDQPMPDLPTSASVASQATVTGAVNLSKLMLIGIYGTESNRYALVRQTNGRMVRVEVGDRLDGGLVVAIKTSELTYQKSGRSLVLTMPRT